MQTELATNCGEEVPFGPHHWCNWSEGRSAGLQVARAAASWRCVGDQVNGGADRRGAERHQRHGGESGFETLLAGPSRLVEERHQATGPDGESIRSLAASCPGEVVRRVELTHV